MILELTEQDLPTLDLDVNDGWTYTVKTRYGKLTGSHIDTKENAIKHAELQVTRIITAILSK